MIGFKRGDLVLNTLYGIYNTYTSFFLNKNTFYVPATDIPLSFRKFGGIDVGLIVTDENKLNFATKKWQKIA